MYLLDSVYFTRCGDQARRWLTEESEFDFLKKQEVSFFPTATGLAVVLSQQII